MFNLDDNMANVCVYGVAMAADILANRWKRLPNIFQWQVLHSYTNNYLTII